MAKKRKLGDRLAFETDKRASTKEKAKSDVLPLKRGIYKPAKPSGASKPAPSPKKKTSKSKPAKSRTLKSEIKKQNRSLKRNQRARRRKPKDMCRKRR